MRRPAGGWPVEADRPGIIDDVDTDTRHGGQYHNHMVQAADTAAESAVRARDGDRAAVRPVGGRSRELMGIAAVVLIFILRQALVVQNLPELDVAAMPGGARARTRQYVDAVGNDGGGVGGGGGSGGRGGGGGFDERRHVNIPASAFEKEVVERVWPPVLGHTLSAPTRRLNSAGEDDYRGRRGLPPAAYVNESQNCQRPYPDQKQCLPYFMGLSCDLCGASALATLLARHPSLAWGMRQEHDFFTRSEFSRVRLPRPPAEHEHGGAGGAGGIGAHIDALEAYEEAREEFDEARSAYMAEFSFRTSTMRAPPRHEHEGHVDPSRAVRARRDINPIPEITDEGNDGPPVLGFDWTPAYFGAAGDVYDVPARVAEMMPWAKFVVLLRDPADSATWNWLVPARLQKPKAMKNETELSTADCTYARLRKWLELFPRERFFVVRYEDMYKGEARRAQILAEVAAFLGVPQVQYRRSHLAEYKLQEVTNAKSRQSDAHRAFAHLDKTTMPAFVARCRALVDNMVGDGGHVWGGEDEVAGGDHWSRVRDAEHFAQRKLVKDDPKTPARLERPGAPKTDEAERPAYANRYTAPAEVRARYEPGGGAGGEGAGEKSGGGGGAGGDGEGGGLPLAGDRGTGSGQRLRRGPS